MAIKLYRNRLYTLESLPPGTKFRTQSGKTGTLVKCNACRALVKLDNTGGGKRVQFTDADGNLHDFIAATSGEGHWAPGCQVYVTEVPRFPYRQEFPKQENATELETDKKLDETIESMREGLRDSDTSEPLGENFEKEWFDD